MRPSNLLHTIQTKIGESGTVQIETVITKGLYRFSILGISQKEASDAKDRVYSALRSSELLNLKSDNRKITVNCTPSKNLEYDHIHDLAIALSCVHCIGGIYLDEKILAVGELTIGGEVLPSQRILQTLYIALQENIQTIVCAEEDIFSLHKDYIQLFIQYKIKVVTGKKLSEIVHRLKANQYYIFNCDVFSPLLSEKLSPAIQPQHTTILEDEVISSIYIALCGKHDIAFEIPVSIFIQDLLFEIYKKLPPINPHQLLYMSDITKESDILLLDTYQKPYVAEIDSQTTKQELFHSKAAGMLDKGKLGIIHIHNLANIPQHIWTSIQKTNHGQIFSVCKPCPCGVQSDFFDTKNRKCSCVQRSILRHQQYLHTEYKDYFTMWVKHTSQLPRLRGNDAQLLIDSIEEVRKLQFQRYCSENNISTPYNEYIHLDYLNNQRNPSLILKSFNTEAHNMYQTISDLYSKNTLHRVVRLSQTLHDIKSIQTKSTAIDKQTVLLALSYMPKKDF